MDVLERRRAIRAWLEARPQSLLLHPPRRDRELREFDLADLDSVDYRRRRLPHWELEHATYFVTFRVRRGRGRPFALGPKWGAIPEAARIVEEAILFGFEDRYALDAYVVMPDHVHLLLTPLGGRPLPGILHGLKSVSALEVNRPLGRSGPLWQDESFDHLVRSEADWIDKREYIHHNPVAAGLVASPGEYPLSSAVTLDPPGRREALRRLLGQ